jgi:hypothetical protein
VRPLRVASHVHSSWSYDGEWALEDLAHTFRRLGYDAVLMAEHCRTFDQQRWEQYQAACSAASTADMLLVPGIEYEDGDNRVHTVVWGPGVPFLGSGRPTLEILRVASEHGAATLMAHPARREAISCFEPEWGSLLSGVEIWNRKYDGIAPNCDAQLLADRHDLVPFAGLDFHNARQFFPLAMSIPAGPGPSASTLVQAIRSGACRPELLGVCASRFTRGAEGASVRAFEDVRRAIRGPVRKLRERAR